MVTEARQESARAGVHLFVDQQVKLWLCGPNNEIDGQAR